MKNLSSYHQQRLWFIDHFEKNDLYVGGPIYHNIPLFFKVSKKIEKKSIEAAILQLTKNHTILRTGFLKEGDHIFQKVSEIEDFHSGTICIEEQEIKNREEELRQKPFDFDSEYLFKVYFDSKEDSTDFLFIFHHAIIDRKSLKLVKKEFLTAIDDTAIGLDKSLQYLDFSNWQNGLTNDDLESLTFYWKSKLKDLQVLYFPTDKEREQVHVYRANKKKFTLRRDQIDSFCRKSNISPRSLFLAAYKMALVRLTGLSDIVIGTLMDLRSESTKNIIGPIENLVVLRTFLQTDKELRELCKTVDQTFIESEEYKTMPFDRLVREINPKKDMSRTALFDILYVYDDNDLNNNANSYDVNDTNQGWGKYDFNLLVSKNRKDYDFVLTYNELYFNSGTVESLLNLIQRLLFSLVKEDEVKLKDIPLLSKDEELNLIHKTISGFEKEDSTIVNGFSQKVERCKDKTALSWSGGSMSYLDLHVRSNQMANMLIDHFDVKVQDAIAVVLPKSEELIVVLLAVLKCGATYVPINPDYPEERKSFILSDTSSKLVIDGDFLNKFSSTIRDTDTNAPEVDVTPSDLAYIIYTSGTTGQPKGVMIEHRNAMSLFKSCNEKFNFSADDSWTFFHSYCFDFSVWEIFGCLLSGGNLVVINDQEARDPESLVRLMNDNKVTIFSQTPSAFYNFMEHKLEIPSLRYVIFGGESLNPLKLKEWSEKHPEVNLINMYGITETTVHVTFKELTQESLMLPVSTIGKPLSFAQCYILDKEQYLLPYGRPGELYVAGEGVARGYLNREELDAEKFIRNPFEKNGKMYRTGDLVRFLDNGEMEYLGRIDDQVKIRGYRIELDEIKKQLDTLTEITQSVIKLIEMPDGDKSIVAYVSVSSNLLVSDIKSHIASKVPEYMVPTFIVIMEQIPMNSNGKIDKSGLPSPLENLSENLIENIAPSNQIESTLFDIWVELLNTDNFGVHHNFFELGGHSLKATRLIGNIHKTFQVKLELKQLFSNPTLREQARLIESCDKKTFSSIKKAAIADSYPLSDAQRRLLILSQVEENSVAYNMPSYMVLNDDHDIENFKKAIKAVISRHEILRTVFKEDDLGDFRQYILSKEELDFQIDIVDFSQEINKDECVRMYTREDSYKPFDLVNGPLIRVSVLKLSNDQYVFYYNMHHIISDGWSIEVLAKDVLAYYEYYRNGKKLELPKLNIQYKDYAIWQQNQVKGDSFQNHRKYWLKQFSGEIPKLNLNIAKKRPLVKTNNGGVISHQLSIETSAGLLELAQNTGTTLYMNVLSVVYMLLYRYSYQKDIIVGSPLAGRENPELKDQIGFYLNTIALRQDLNHKGTYTDLLENVKNIVLEGFEHQEYPFDTLIEDVGQAKDLSRSPLFDVLLVLNEEVIEQKQFTTEKKELKSSEELNVRSKFDITFYFTVSDSEIRYDLIYNKDLFDDSTINKLSIDFVSLFEQIVQDSSNHIEDYCKGILDDVENDEQESFTEELIMSIDENF
ncbi:non-ribosomal peptide synthetase [Aquimarina latercula]|uniref:non-ribosomal peptide synthetase n=1 Tax=Aquimarina latercula TaxID=987 RepID=UPI000428DF2E|nr:non-ribosomal peptide synthetase [Aquimarina latercula]